ncbi:MAG TPA: hypothetical protein VFQ61_02620 [Polyangiaceae bacterium]|nr:hypothetical protein [Polyangiaceae bacterium]
MSRTRLPLAWSSFGIYLLVAAASVACGKDSDSPLPPANAGRGGTDGGSAAGGTAHVGTNTQSTHAQGGASLGGSGHSGSDSGGASSGGVSGSSAGISGAGSDGSGGAPPDEAGGTAGQTNEPQHPDWPALDCPGPVKVNAAPVESVRLDLQPGTPWLQNVVEPTLSAPTEMGLSASIALLFGDDYTSARLDFPAQVLDPRCCCTLLGSGLTLTNVSDVEGAVDATLEGNASVRVTARSLGTGSFTVRGTMTFPAGQLASCAAYEQASALPIFWKVSAVVREPKWRLQNMPGCAANAAMLSGQALPIWVAAYDGETLISPANAAHPAIEITGEGVSLRVPESARPQEVIAEGDGKVRLSIPGTDLVHELRVVPPSKLDKLEIAWALAGRGGAMRQLSTGETYTCGARTGNRLVAVVSKAYTDDLELCGPILTQDINLRSLTPETCQVDAQLCEIVEIPDGDLIQRTAEIKTDGVCAVRLEAPEYARGQGLEETLSVTLSNTDNLGDLTPGD